MYSCTSYGYSSTLGQWRIVCELFIVCQLEVQWFESHMQVCRLSPSVFTYRCRLIATEECQPSRLRQGYTNKWTPGDWGSPLPVQTPQGRLCKMHRCLQSITMATNHKRILQSSSPEVLNLVPAKKEASPNTTIVIYLIGTTRKLPAYIQMVFERG